jgi:hypothetical protein
MLHDFVLTVCEGFCYRILQWLYGQQLIHAQGFHSTWNQHPVAHVKTNWVLPRHKGFSSEVLAHYLKNQIVFLSVVHLK